MQINPPKKAVMCLDSWAGRREFPVEIIGHTPERWRVRFLTDVNIRYRKYTVGNIALIPKKSVRISEP